MKMGDRNASTSSVPFADLNNKDWLARDMAIEPAFDITVHTAAGDTEAEEESLIDTKQLY